MVDFHNPYDCKWPGCSAWEEDTEENEGDDHILTEVPSQNIDHHLATETISILQPEEPEESDVWWKLTRRSSCDSNTSTTTFDSQQMEIIVQPGLHDCQMVSSTTPIAPTSSDVFWKLTRRWSYETNSTSATNDYSRQVTISEEHNCIYEVPSRSELFESTAAAGISSLFLTSDELQKSRTEADTELRLSLSCSDPDLSYYSAMNLLFKRPSSISPPLSSSSSFSSSSHAMNSHNPPSKRHIVILCMDTSMVQRKMMLSAIIRDHRAIMSTDVLYLRHSGEYDYTEYEHNIEPLDVVILDETMCVFSDDSEDQGQGLGRLDYEGMMDVASMVGLIKSQHPHCLVVATVSAVEPSTLTSAPSSSSSRPDLSSSSSSTSSSPMMDDDLLSSFTHHNITVMPIRSDGNNGSDGFSDNDSNSLDGDGSTDSESCGGNSSSSRCTSSCNSHCTSSNSSSNSSSSSRGNSSGGSGNDDSCSGNSCCCSLHTRNNGVGVDGGSMQKGKDELFLLAGVDVVWEKPTTSAWSRKSFTLSVNTPSQHTLPLTLYPYTLSPTLSIHPLNTPYHHILSPHPIHPILIQPPSSNPSFYTKAHDNLPHTSSQCFPSLIQSINPFDCRRLVVRIGFLFA